ncbi:TetR/AcrR family transcriptional regulator [Nocardioides daejeonensis]|uniref:TetR/AcrR family transcriptional regulator n=1 Tax=Nocardioides daejeonensis TaxID=1046556 RepID=UPI000D744D54|nr:TetR/AcrR family transcriptional regulator [Nocardioides daejeonensis]
MRPSNRSKILEAAVRVAQRDGVTAVTLDSVAAEASLTKGGLMYHFPSKDALLAGIQEHVSTVWDSLMAQAAGKDAGEATAEERLAAYAEVATQSATSADLAFVLEFSKDPNSGRMWPEVANKWTPSPESAAADPHQFDLFIARLAADGLWMFEALMNQPLPEELRQQIAARISTMITAPDGPSSAD